MSHFNLTKREHRHRNTYILTLNSMRGCFFEYILFCPHESLAKFMCQVDADGWKFSMHFTDDVGRYSVVTKSSIHKWCNCLFCSVSIGSLADGFQINFIMTSMIYFYSFRTKCNDFNIQKKT